jgi:hypothetical protein
LRNENKGFRTLFLVKGEETMKGTDSETNVKLLDDETKRRRF